MSFSSIFNNVRNYMSANYMFVDQDWLSDCVSHLIENNFNENEIKSQTREQWLLNNLTDICPGCLPPNLKSLFKTELPGRYVLQINAAVDIGTPAYQQYLKLQKVNTENIEATKTFDENVPSHRMIKLYMTDGVQEVTGIEYKPMRNLTLDVVPGSKVLIKGPVECRRGMLLLIESAIELLGGEVSEIIGTNSQAGILCTKLNIPVPQSSSLDTTVNQPRNRNIPSPHIQNPPIINDIQQVQQPMTNFIEDEIDINELDAIEAQYSDSITKRSSDDDISNPEKKFKKSELIYDVPDEEMFSEDEDYLRELEAKFDEKENELSMHNSDVSSTEITLSKSKDQDGGSNVVTMPIEPFVYLKQINDLDEIERIGKVFRVKAQILKILTKLSVGKEGWSLRCTIVDGTATLDVDFSSDALSKLVGFTPQEMIQMKRQMATNAEVKNAAVLALQKAKDNLQVLYCIIEITIMERPIITQLMPFESSHVEALRKRLQDSGL